MDRPGRAGLDDVGAAGLLEGGPASAQTQESLAKDLQNPVASLISIPSRAISTSGSAPGTTGSVTP